MELSIIVPVYNVEKYLSRCLDSLLRQGLEVGEYEVICVNDGSPDNCGAILDDYKQRFPDIFKIITQENQGLGYARNTGMKVAKGEYITFVDSDDYVVEGGYVYLYEHFLIRRPDVLSFSCKILKEHEVVKGDSKPFEGKVFFEGRGRDAYNQHYRRIRSVWSKCYRRSFLMKHDILFENIVSEDVLFNFEVFRCNPLVVMTDYKIYRYMQDNQDSILRSKTREKQNKLMDGRVYVTGVMNKYLSEDGGDMMDGLKWTICAYMNRFYMTSFHLRYSKKEWQQYMKQIRRMGVNKFLCERKRTMTQKLIPLFICSTSHSYLMYIIICFLYTNIYVKRITNSFIINKKQIMKTLDEFVTLFSEQFDDTDASEFTSSTEFRALDEWSSLIGLSVIAMVDEEFDVALKGNDIRQATTIEDLYNIVKSKL